MKAPKFLTNPRLLMYVGVAMFVLANPLLYLVLGGLIIDFRNLLGADIDRRTVEFNTNDPFIQAMNLISILGVATFFIGKFISYRIRRNG